ncbi:MAG TPA: helix-turn-helix transcriptional regulator [Rhizomicrobium sp.]|jgi:transcriptional regulator with XRE-family HTH domain|nr:helix-turn-helix transcriptional regulator [Rhizomicrobium sp.]
MAIYHCRIRKYRKSAHLSQRELALLVGLRSQGALSDIEAGRKHPSVGVAFSCEIVLGTSARELFPRLYRKLEVDALRAARRLQERLRRRKGRSAAVANVAALITRIEIINRAHDPQA